LQLCSIILCSGQEGNFSGSPELVGGPLANLEIGGAEFYWMSIPTPNASSQSTS